MPNEFDPYREALVVETATVWPDEYEGWETTDRHRVDRLLHQNPQNASELQYVRQHTGFCRQITVTSDDINRLG